MAEENFEQFYAELLMELRISLVSSEEVWAPPPPVDEEKRAQIKELLAKLPPEHNRWIALKPRTLEEQKIRDLLPPHQLPYAGFQLVDIARLSTFALIAFRWRERDEVFVHTVDLYPFVTGPYDVKTAEAIISMNLLEQLGGQWQNHRSLITVNGLTFFK